MWEDSVCKIIKLGYGKGPGNKAKYIYKGVEYEEFSERSVSIYGMVPGEKYAIKINPENPKKYVILDWKPVFTNDEHTCFTSGRVTRVYRFGYFKKNPERSKYGVEFVYKVGDIEIERSQHLPPSCMNYCNIRKGDVYEVAFLHDDVYRSILNIDNKIQSSTDSIKE